MSAIADAGPGDLTFFSNPKYAAELRATRASAVILSPDAGPAACAMLRHPQPYLAFARAVELFADGWRPPAGAHPQRDHRRRRAAGGERLRRSVRGGRRRRGDRRPDGRSTRTSSSARKRGSATTACSTPASRFASGSLVGARVVVQDGAVIGSDGFGFVTDADGVHHKIPQQSRVVIEDDVEIGANTTIDRPAVGETRIGAGTKIDNLVQIAHGVRSASTRCSPPRSASPAARRSAATSTLAGQVGVAGHLEIGDKASAPPRRRDPELGRGRRVRLRLSRRSTTATGSSRQPCSGACPRCGRHSPSSRPGSLSSKPGSPTLPRSISGKPVHVQFPCLAGVRQPARRSDVTPGR